MKYRLSDNRVLASYSAGLYNDDYRATVFADVSGCYHFESNVPSPYTSRLPHIHVCVSAKGYQMLITWSLTDINYYHL